MNQIILSTLLLLVGLVIGFGLTMLINTLRKNNAIKKIEEMFSNAQNTAAAPTIENITIQQPEEKKASLPDYIKNMQEDMKKEEEISLFKDGGKYSEDVYASVNGEHRFQIQRGKKVKVPKYIAEVIKSSQEQDTKTEEMMRQKQEESLKRLSEMK